MPISSPVSRQYPLLPSSIRLSASSILRISLRSRSRVRSSRLNSSSWVARSFGSGKLAASSFMWETVRSTSCIRSRFQLSRICWKCVSWCLLMYCSPRLATYGCTLRGPDRRLPGSELSPSSVSGAVTIRVACEATVAAVNPLVEGPCADGPLAGAAGRCGLWLSGLRSVPALGADLAAGLAVVAATALRLAAAGRRGSGRRAAAFGRTAFLGLLILDPGFLPGIASLLTWSPVIERTRDYTDARKRVQSIENTAPSGRLGQCDRLRSAPKRRASLGDHLSRDAAAHMEVRAQPHEARRHRAREMVDDLVGHGLVERAAVAKRPDIELEGLELNAEPVGHIFELEGREIRLPGARTQAGEFRNADPDGVVGLGGRIGESLDLAGRMARHGWILCLWPHRKRHADNLHERGSAAATDCVRSQAT